MSTVAQKIVAAPIATQMKAAQVTEFGKPLAVHTVPVPECGDEQCLVRVTACGVCHTDLHVRDGDWGEGAKCPLPTTPGHEGVGIVVKIGANVKAVQVGDRVGLPWLHTACSHCRECQQGWETTCKFQKQTGFSVNGAFAEYCVADPNFVAKIPDSLTDIQAAPILCAGVTTYKGLKESGVRPGQFIVITGAGGGLGHVAVQYAIAMGMRVIGVDGGAHKMEFLKSLGCEFTIDFMTCKDMVAEVRRLTGDYEGAHGALMLAAVPMCFTQAVHYLRPNGTVICIALPPGSFQVPHLQITLKALNVKGSIVGTRIDLLEALEIAGRGLVKCTVAERPLGDVNEVLEELHKMKVDGRVVLKLID